MDPAAHPIADEKYVSLTTFRRSGTPVSTPVWVAPALDGDGLVVITVDETGKTKRLGHTARVELRPCDVRGRVPEDAPVATGEASVVRDGPSVVAVRRAIVAKYGMQARGFDAVNALTRRLNIRTKPRAGIVIHLDEEAHAP
ncbi:PPOX class F420-dependent oxidoreductase [Phycicoccus sp. BSK3Z-2]|uniref:PPOX class F420-dependent oxidoreductase n=1 Tax=Phycicoccus avicenniae TaxID=2828860 RepID=A0A941I175_9MICO|nr:PPOX class F420-dependent oxidoreductase [Phycicoccus avicenniae]MBR7744006.1 PPOX class F420-dependent oxidoreductase [Phycicoccus avicenniae]